MVEPSVATLPPMRRFAVRGPEAAAREVAAAFGVALPARLLTAARNGGRAVLWLGPDEWLMLAEAGAEAPAHAAASVVEASDAHVAVRVANAGAGAGAAELLNEACPLDLSDQGFPPGACTRTLFGKAEIVLWRPGPEAEFHVEVARSFAGYLLALLEAARTA
jgi:sarcosine oxidase subunit gamma